MNEMDPSGAYEASGGNLVYDEMGWGEAPLSDTSFVLSKPEDIALATDDDDDLAQLTDPFGLSARESTLWNVILRHYGVFADGESGEKELETTLELTYHIVVYKDGRAELYLYGTTASDTLCFQGTVSSIPIG